MSDQENKKPETKKLPEDVAKEFVMGKHAVGKIILPKRYGGEEIDFEKISIEKARKLAAMEDFPYLVKVNPAAGGDVTTKNPPVGAIKTVSKD